MIGQFDYRRKGQAPEHTFRRSVPGLAGPARPAHSQDMTQHDLALVSSSATGPSVACQLDRAVAAYLTRFTGSFRERARSDVRCFLAWCADRSPDPLAARRPHLELYIRSMQETHRHRYRGWPGCFSAPDQGRTGVDPDRPGVLAAAVWNRRPPELLPRTMTLTSP